jgi:L-threonylcarbamoyladenylate synthase
MNDEIKKAVEVLKSGGIIIFPTDTAFGIGCRMDDENVVAKLFDLRRRPLEKAVPVLADSIEMVKKHVSDFPNAAEDLAKKYWPGALTIILKSNTSVPSLVCGGGDTVGFRVPNNETIREIISEAGVPILGPSANFAGEKTPFAFEDLDKELVKLVDFVVPGECTIKKPSTVIDCSKEPFCILREGAIRL